MLVGILLASLSLPASAADPNHPDQRTPEFFENPTKGAIGVTAVVEGPAPTTGARILSPRSGSVVTNIPLTVSGICPSNLIVSIVKNDVFAGSTACSPDGAFSLPIDLFDGQNTLVARVQDAIGQNGPDSAAVVVTYNSPAFLAGVPAALGKQLFLQAPFATQGTSVGTKVTWRFRIVGGTAPFAVSYDWGDGKSDLASVSSEGEIAHDHVYDRPGNYRVVVRVTDTRGNSALMQVVTVVAGETKGAATAGSSGDGMRPGLLLSWPLYGFATLMVVSFWLGERRELGMLRRRGQLLER